MDYKMIEFRTDKIYEEVKKDTEEIKKKVEKDTFWSKVLIGACSLALFGLTVFMAAKKSKDEEYF